MQHPGEILLEQFMKPRNISQNSLARNLHVPPQRINDLVKARRSITPDTAMRLGFYFGNSPTFWLELQNRYDLETAEESGLASEIRQSVRRPTELHLQRPGARQRQIEDKSLRIHRRIAEKLQQNPKPVLDKARRNIRNWGWDKESCPTPYMTAWQQILNMPPEKIVKIITSPGEKGTLLRSTSPFDGVLTEGEKQQLLESQKENVS